MSRYESTPAPVLTTSAEIGAYGERVAAAFVRRHGYKVLTRNYQTTRGEIDLVCRHGDVLVFVEVKTRAESAIVPPSEAIDAAKEEALQETARRYLELLDLPDIHHRFDAVEVRLKAGEIPVCTLLPNYFG
ncbi:MAG: YraN family protein [Methylacidiphilales bacterium]|nr:YraN family protein [Candidatus Methylacidiphilales bacterium]